MRLYGLQSRRQTARARYTTRSIKNSNKTPPPSFTTMLSIYIPQTLNDGGADGGEAGAGAAEKLLR